MPVLNVAAFRRRQEEPRLAPIPVVAMTGVSDSSQQAMGAVAAAHFLKPYTASKLLATVARYCCRDGARRRVMRAIGRAIVAGTYRWLKPWIAAIEQQHEAQGIAGLASGLLHLPGFLVRLADEITRAHRYAREIGLVMFEVPVAPKRQQRELEVALRDCLRKSDVPARLTDHMLAALLPETSHGTEAAAKRIGGLLSRVAGTTVASGFARYPADGPAGADLIRAATERTHPAAAPAPEPGRN